MVMALGQWLGHFQLNARAVARQKVNSTQLRCGLVKSHKVEGCLVEVGEPTNEGR